MGPKSIFLDPIVNFICDRTYYREDSLECLMKVKTRCLIFIDENFCTMRIIKTYVYEIIILKAKY